MHIYSLLGPRFGLSEALASSPGSRQLWSNRAGRNRYMIWPRPFRRMSGPNRPCPQCLYIWSGHSVARPIDVVSRSGSKASSNGSAIVWRRGARSAPIGQISAQLAQRHRSYSVWMARAQCSSLSPGLDRRSMTPSSWSRLPGRRAWLGRAPMRRWAARAAILAVGSSRWYKALLAPSLRGSPKKRGLLSRAWSALFLCPQRHTTSAIG